MSTYEKRGGNGGRRAGAGRPKGAVSKRSERSIASLTNKYPEMPRDYMLRVMNDPRASNARRDAMARYAAPYVHPKLATIQVRRVQRYSVDIEKLTDEELAGFERLLLKCQVPDNERTNEELEAVLPPTVKLP